MLSKNEIKFIKSLDKKRERDECQLFVAEGSKLVIDIIRSGGDVNQIYATKGWTNSNQKTVSDLKLEPIEISDSEMDRITSLSSPSPILAIFKQQTNSIEENFESNSILILDDIRDPGNLGTIIRTADWFGIKQIICSPETTDCYNPKVIQSTMGSIMRVKIQYTELENFIKNHKGQFTYYGTFMNGVTITGISYNKRSAFIIGNEAHGISESIEKIIDQKIAIPAAQIADGVDGPESLNAAISTSIVLYDYFSKSKSL
jgi:TrmH family RNA methyltransferase